MDNYLTKPDSRTPTEFFHGILLWASGFVLTAMISRLAKNFQDYFINVMTQKIWTSIYQNTISHTFSLPYAAFEDQQSWQLLQKLIKAKESIQTYIANLISIVFFSLVGIVFVLVYSFSVDRRVGLAYLLLMPIVWFTTMSLSKKIKSAQASISIQSNTLSWSITESIRNVSLIKMLGLVEQEITRIDVANNKILDLELDKVKKVRTMEFLQGTLINTMRVSLITILWYLVYKGSISVGQLLSLYFYSFFLFWQLSQFWMVVKSYQEARANHDILQEILRKEVEPTITDGVVMNSIDSISSKNLSFSYDTGKQVLNNISFSIEKWKTVAFVWPSGSGKSTILKLICGLYFPTHGNIYFHWIDSTGKEFDSPLSLLDRTSYQQNIWIVSQDAQLFSGTIRENLLFVQPQASDQDCRDSLEYAQLASFINTLPDSLDTIIGEGGIKLSGGQRQRLAIARALLRKPSILIFDEATSALDSIVEKEISDTILSISNKNDSLITVLVAHRLSTVMKADSIYVLEQGTIVEFWSHEKLIQEKGLYSALWREQRPKT